MPSHQQILESLRRLANDFGGVAVAWHVLALRPVQKSWRAAGGCSHA